VGDWRTVPPVGQVAEEEPQHGPGPVHGAGGPCGAVRCQAAGGIGEVGCVGLRPHGGDVLAGSGPPEKRSSSRA
jgi:hypothetical protein